MSKRILSPTPIPPRRKHDTSGAITLKFVITGWVPSKKNMQTPTINHGLAASKMNTYINSIPQSSTLKMVQYALKQYIAGILKSTRPYIRNPKKFQAWETETKQKFQDQLSYWRAKHADKGLSFPITKASISIYHYWADERQRDNSNKGEAIYDALVSSGILLDDNYKTLYKITSEAGCYAGEITTHITEIFITAHRW